MSTAKSSFATLGAGNWRIKIHQHLPTAAPGKPVFRSLGSSPVCLRKPRHVARQAQTRAAVVETAAAEVAAAEVAAAEAPSPDISSILSPVIRVKQALFAQDGVPNEQSILAALGTCKSVARLVQHLSIRSALTDMPIDSDTAASTLLSLDTNKRAKQTHKPQASEPLHKEDLTNDLADAAYEIISHPAVVITPQVLELYIDIQALLGRPETLPHVLGLYASKRMPPGHSSWLEQVKQKLDRAVNAVDPKIVEKALSATIEAKNLDAAVGVIESSYATREFVRAKILKNAFLPVSALIATPFAAYSLASMMAPLQNSMEQGTATALATTGILAYVFFTGSLGVIAFTSQNDHMKRVTWLPGLPLRERWLREEERAALDRVACSFGFSDSRRYGEEEGAEFQALREFILRKGMILDRVELMEGME